MSKRVIYVAFLDDDGNPDEAQVVTAWSSWDEDNLERDKLMEMARDEASLKYGEDGKRCEMRVAEIHVDDAAIRELFVPSAIDGEVRGMLP